MDWNLTSLTKIRSSYSEMCDVYNTIRILNKINLKICFGCFYPMSQEITLFGNSDNISEIIKSFNHEYYHYITEKLLKRELGYNDFTISSTIDCEYGVDLLTDKTSRKIHNKMYDFVLKLWKKIINKELM